jgi:DNA-binding transcriptional MerR regulator
MSRLAISALLATFLFPIPAFAQVQTFTATHAYILGDHDSKDDARQRCLLEAKRNVLDQAGIYIESQDEVKDLHLTKSQITSFAAAVLRVEVIKEEFGYEHGHNKLTLTIKAEVDLADVRKQIAARQVDNRLRERLAKQEQQLQQLEKQVEQLREQKQSPGLSQARTKQFDARSVAPPNTTGTYEDGRATYDGGDHPGALKLWRPLAESGNTKAQVMLGMMYMMGDGVLPDYATGRKWLERAAEQGDADARGMLGNLKLMEMVLPADFIPAVLWSNMKR